MKLNYLNYIILIVLFNFHFYSYSEIYRKNIKKNIFRYNYENYLLTNQLIPSTPKNHTLNKKLKKNNKTDYQKKLLTLNFAKNKKKLPWPIKNGIVFSKFGKHPHPLLNHIISDNSGIQFATYKGSNVFSVFSGTICNIKLIPGGNKAIIIQHGDYFTTYTNLKKIFVKAGENVKAKKKLGEIYTDKNGYTLLKFQIWKGINKINPEDWLINL